MMRAKGEERHFTGGVLDCCSDEYFTLLYAEDAWYRFIGYTKEEFADKFQNRLFSIISEDRRHILEEIRKQVHHDGVFMYENQLRCKDGTEKWIWISAQLVQAADKEPYFHCIFHDITEEKQLEQDLIISEKRLYFVLSMTQDIVFEYDWASHEIYYSDNFERKFGYTIPVNDFPESMFRENIVFKDDIAILRDGFQSIFKGENYMQCEYRLKYREEGYRWVYAQARGLRNQNKELIKILGVITDIHEQKEAILKSQEEAALDPLTGLNNRRECIRRIHDYIANNKKLMAFILIDIDDFKLINDMYGHTTGDEALLYIAEGLHEIIRHDDIVARIGGDEFVVCLQMIPNEDVAIRKIKDIQQVFRRSITDQLHCEVNCSIGASFYPVHGKSFEELLEAADIAMYQAKDEGKNRFCVYKGEGKAKSYPMIPQQFMQKGFHDHVIEYVMRILLEHPNHAEEVKNILKLVNKVFICDRMSIFEKTKNGYQLFQEWCSDEKYKIEKVQFTIADRLLESKDIERKMLVYEDIDALEDEDMRVWFQERATKTALACLLKEKDEIRMIICYENCQMVRSISGEERYTLLMIAQILQLFLNQERYLLQDKKQQLERMQFLSESIPGGMVGMYCQDKLPIYFINPKMLRFLGYASEAEFLEAVDGSFLQTIYKEDRAMVLESMQQQLKEHREYSVAFRVVKKNQEVIWVSSKGKRITHSDGNEAILALCVNIAKQKEYQNQLAIYRNSNAGGAFMVALDEVYTLLYANDLYYQLFEITPQQMETKYQNHGIALLPANEHKRIKALIELSLKNGESELKCEFEAVTDKGTHKWLFLSGTFGHDENGQNVMSGFLQDHTREHELMEALSHKEMIYRTALEESHICVWEYDIEKKIMYMSENGKDRHAMQTVTKNMPEALLEQKLVHPESWPTIRDMYAQMEQGVPYTQGDVLTATKNRDGWWWERVTYTTIFDRNGKPIQAVAVGEDITKQKAAQAYYQQQMQQHVVITGSMLARFRFNLTKNEIIQIEGTDITKTYTSMAFHELLAMQEWNVAFEEDRIRFKKIMGMAALKEAYAQGKTIINCEYRRKGKDGRLFWVNGMGRLFMDAKSGDLYLHGILMDIDERKKIELALKKKPEMDDFPNVYKENAFKEMLKQTLLLPKKDRQQEAILLFEIDHESEISRVDKAGVDRIQAELAALLVTGFACSKLLGRLKDGVFALWIKSEATKNDLCEIVEYIRKTVGIPYMFSDMNFKVTLSCSIVLLHQTKNSDEAMKLALDALHQAKEKGGNCYVLKEEEIPNSSIQKQISDLFTGDRVSEDRLLKTLYTMNLEKSFSKSLYRAVEEVMLYYGGDRAYLIDYSDSAQLYEVRKDGVDSLKEVDDHLLQPEVFENKNLKELLFGIQVLEDVETLKDSDPSMYAYLKGLNIHCSMLACMNDNGHVIGYLGIDNYSKRADHPGFLRMLSYYLTNELTKMKLQKKQLYIHYHDYLSGALNRTSFQQYRQELNEERLISLGIVSVDINGLRDINHLYGNAYGDDIIRRITHLLEKIFVNGNVYRFTGDEFLVIVEDMTNEMFQSYVTKLQKQMQKICDVSIGFVWSDTNKQLDQLIAHADEQRLINKQLYYSYTPNEHNKRNTKVLKGILKEIKEGRFMVYLQKKIDSNTNEIEGFEALIRYQNADGTLVAPNRFIPMLEKLGIIHYIDFFVFRQVHEILLRWMQQKRKLVPISLNFSRVTLLEDDLANRMNSISETYAIDRSFIEIEITESVGDIERTTMEAKCKEIKEAGYRISLDDFGSKYSNIAFLSSVSFNVLKLDKGLNDDIISNYKARAIISSIINLCKALHIEVIAEGVEYIEQVEILKELGCHLIQGYYYGKPIPNQDFDKE